MRINSRTAHSTVEIVIHYENQTPFLTVTNLERVIEVSHWGNIAVEETIDIVHTGAALKGSFSRYDFQKDTRGAQSCVKSYKTILPASASGVYYRYLQKCHSLLLRARQSDEFSILSLRFPQRHQWKHLNVGDAHSERFG